MTSIVSTSGTDESVVKESSMGGTDESVVKESSMGGTDESVVEGERSVDEDSSMVEGDVFIVKDTSMDEGDGSIIEECILIGENVEELLLIALTVARPTSINADSTTFVFSLRIPRCSLNRRFLNELANKPTGMSTPFILPATCKQLIKINIKT